MSCCSAQGADKFFSRVARRYAKKFRRRGLDRASTLLVHGLQGLGMKSALVLDVGCGIGGVHLTLLKNGAASAQGVEVSEGMISAALDLADEMGLRDRVSYVRGDFADSNGRILTADITVLDKVVCCYPFPHKLISKAAEKTRALCAISYPRNSFLGRTAFKCSSWIGEALHWSFHPYYHDTSLIDAAIRECGFEEMFSATTIIWQVKIYRRKNLRPTAANDAVSIPASAR